MTIKHFGLACVALGVAVGRFLRPTSGSGDIDRFNLEQHFWPTLKISCSVLLKSYPKL